MGWPQVLSVLVSGSQNNWFGFACPAHCTFSLPRLLLALATGALLGVGSTLYTFRHLIFIPSPVTVDTPQPVHPPRPRPSVSGNTCMSEPSSSESLRRLTSAVTDLTAALERLTVCGDPEWELVQASPSSRDPRLTSRGTLSADPRFLGCSFTRVEESPPLAPPALFAEALFLALTFHGG